MGALSWLSGRSYDERTLNGTNETSRSNVFRYPESHDEWRARYQWLWEGYTGEPYRVASIKALGLFRALDDNDKVIAETKRLTRDIQHVVDTDAQALAGRRLVLANANETPAALAMERAGKEVWARSRFTQRVGSWARTGASMGSVFVEAVRMNPSPPYETTLVAYDPRRVHAVYDDTGTRLERVYITTQILRGPRIVNGRLVDEGGNAPLDDYVREIDAERVTVYRNGEMVEAESGEHGAGVVPVVHLPFIPVLVDPAHGIWAAQGLDMALSLVDSMLTQVLAIGNRHANPTPVLIGGTFLNNDGSAKFGRAISGIQPGGDFKYAEATMSGVGTLLDAAQQAREQVRATLPEFLFTQAGASASGAALNFWAAAFAAKMEEVRGRWYSAFVEITQIAAAMDDATTADLDPQLTINAPPVLPVSVETELNAVTKAREEGGLLRVDYIRHLQRLGIVPSDADPEQYAADVTEERATEDERLAALVQGGGVPAVDVAMDDDEPEDGSAAALNGAQVQAAQGIVESVAVGEIPRDTALNMLTSLFGLPSDTADRILGSVGRGFRPDRAEE